MTRTEALRKLYKKVTNEEAPVTANTITEVLVALADKYSGDEPVAANTITDALVALADNYSGGGGGSSDFSTAQVTAAIAGDYMQIPFVYDEGGEAGIVSTGITESGTYSVPIYKGMLVGSIDATRTVNVSGNAEYDQSNHVIIITGDCTITIS